MKLCASKFSPALGRTKVKGIEGVEPSLQCYHHSELELIVLNAIVCLTEIEPTVYDRVENSKTGRRYGT